MPELEFASGGQSVIMQQGIAVVAQYTYHAYADGRFYGIGVCDGGSCQLSLTVDQTLRHAVLCSAVDDAKDLAQAWEQLTISADDLLYDVLVPKFDHLQRESIAKIDLRGRHAQREVYDVRVSMVGTPAAADGFMYYVVAYKIKTPPGSHVGGTQIYP